MSTELLARAAGVLAEAGIDAPLSLAGHAHDVLVVHVAPAALATVHEASPRLRALGIRYVTIEISAGHA